MKSCVQESNCSVYYRYVKINTWKNINLVSQSYDKILESDLDVVKLHCWDPLSLGVFETNCQRCLICY